jgi:uncharacterized membrane protein
MRNDRKELIMMKTIVAAILSLSLACAGCAGMSDTQQRTLSGAAIGTAAGGIIGAVAGNTGMGLAIGAAAGAGSGYLYGKHKETEQAAYQKGVQDGKKAQ